MGTPFGKYTLARKLAEGGMAEVYLARQGGLEGFEKLVVIKRILPNLSGDQAFIKMFLNEARVAARLNHPNIVQIWDLGKNETLYYIAMEFVHGEDLRELISIADQTQKRPPHGLTCRIIADTLAGLHYAHTRATPDGKPMGLVHRDVSPQNILVTYEGSTKLVDFGIAKATQATNEQTQAGLFKGKFAYMSPEQSTGKPLDARSDVFAVGILLWELCTWHRLFKRQSDMATLIAVAEDRIPPADELDATVPPELTRIIAKSLTRSLDERYQSAHDMRADLENLIRNERWEGDAMALQGYMRELFAEKLRAQESDIKAAGLASLDDYLLQVEESTRISWMPAKSPNEKRTPSVGLPSASDKPTPKVAAAPPLPGTRPVPPGPPPKPPSLPLTAAPEAKTAPEMKAPDLFQVGKPSTGAFAGGVTRPDPAAPLLADRTMITPASGPVSAPAPLNGHAVTQPANLPPPRREDINATAPGAMTSPFASFNQPAGNESTAKRTSFDPPPTNFFARIFADPSKRRLFIIGAAVLLVLLVTLTILLWPSSSKTIVLPPPDTNTTPPPPVSDEPQLPIKPKTAKPKDTPATLSITCDVVAVVSVDGEAQPAGKSVEIKVKPNVPHTITAQRAGHHTMKTIRVQPLGPGETLPIKISVK